MPIFIAAGQWQWNKARLKSDLQQQLEAGGAQTALSMPGTLVDPSTLLFRKIVAQGAYEPQYQILIDNRTYRGQAG